MEVGAAREYGDEVVPRDRYVQARVAVEVLHDNVGEVLGHHGGPCLLDVPGPGALEVRCEVYDRAARGRRHGARSWNRPLDMPVRDHLGECTG